MAHEVDNMLTSRFVCQLNIGLSSRANLLAVVFSTAFALHGYCQEWSFASVEEQYGKAYVTNSVGNQLGIDSEIHCNSKDTITTTKNSSVQLRFNNGVLLRAGSQSVFSLDAATQTIALRSGTVWLQWRGKHAGGRVALPCLTVSIASSQMEAVDTLVLYAADNGLSKIALVNCRENSIRITLPKTQEQRVLNAGEVAFVEPTDTKFPISVRMSEDVYKYDADRLIEWISHHPKKRESNTGLSVSRKNNGVRIGGFGSSSYDKKLIQKVNVFCTELMGNISIKQGSTATVYFDVLVDGNINNLRVESDDRVKAFAELCKQAVLRAAPFDAFTEEMKNAHGKMRACEITFEY